ncbi:hypothetical protein BBJ28_00024568 [Nothophytophthora sp. Chile5]|nr:hypothetical protein BBJ28_00024568 [Nothophytophthora sp. Chile5]
MKRFPNTLALQRDGLLCLAEYAHQADEHVATITSNGGIISIVDAMAALPDDVPANMAGLSVLAHPKIAGALPVCEKARLRFPADLKVQQHAVQAIQTMLPGESIEPEEPATCALQ